eukprot:GDKJ01035558.1.p1 GENE.GDKJ01035558.1~~GDKJ01035558.1.p1  ORF type:complete len:528 (+),score=148.32 GDKJ01035558.1:211-1584(+)
MTSQNPLQPILTSDQLRSCIVMLITTPLRHLFGTLKNDTSDICVLIGSRLVFQLLSVTAASISSSSNKLDDDGMNERLEWFSSLFLKIQNTTPLLLALVPHTSLTTLLSDTIANVNPLFSQPHTSSHMHKQLSGKVLSEQILQAHAVLIKKAYSNLPAHLNPLNNFSGRSSHPQQNFNPQEGGAPVGFRETPHHQASSRMNNTFAPSTVTSTPHPMANQSTLLPLTSNSAAANDLAAQFASVSAESSLLLPPNNNQSANFSESLSTSRLFTPTPQASQSRLASSTSPSNSSSVGPVAFSSFASFKPSVKPTVTPKAGPNVDEINALRSSTTLKSKQQSTSNNINQSVNDVGVSKPAPQSLLSLSTNLNFQAIPSETRPLFSSANLTAGKSHATNTPQRASASSLLGSTTTTSSPLFTKPSNSLSAAGGGMNQAASSGSSLFQQQQQGFETMWSTKRN